MIRKFSFLQWYSFFLVFLISLTGCSGQSIENTATSTYTATIITNSTEINIQKSEDKNTESEDIAPLEVHFIDVGQGDCTLIICDGHAMIIDAGNNDKGSAIQLYLKKQGIKKLDYAIGTHPDADHIGGLDVILYKFDCKTVIMPDYTKDTRTYDDVIQTLKNKNYKITNPVVGTTYSLGSATFSIIAPNGSYGSNANDFSIEIVLQHGNNKFIFTGDAEENSETDIIRNGIDISADVYKVSHHGSKSATTQAFLNTVNPEYAVISCGEENSYGHPHTQTLNTLRSMEISVFRTDEQGTIVATSDSKDIIWNCSPSVTWQAGEGNKSDQEVGTTTVSTKQKTTTPAAEGLAYIINTNTGKFHYPACSSVNQMADKNRLESTLNRDELVSQGYSPCGRCNP